MQKDVLRHGANHLEGIMLPEFVDIRESFLRTLTGKLLSVRSKPQRKGCYEGARFILSRSTED